MLRVLVAVAVMLLLMGCGAQGFHAKPIAVGNDENANYSKYVHCEKQYWENGTYWCVPWRGLGG